MSLFIDFWVILKTPIVNLFKPFHDVIIHFATFSLEFKKFDKRSKFTKVCSQEAKECFRWNKKHFPYFFEGFLLEKLKK